MKAIPLLASLFLTSVAVAGEVNFRVSSPTVNGTAHLVNRIQKDGSKYVQLSLVLKDDAGKSVTVLQESTYDHLGRPRRMLQTTTMKGGASKQSVTVLFDDAGAHVTVTAGGKSLRRNVPYPPNQSYRATPEFWVMRDQVAPGGQTNYFRFDLGTTGWVETKAIYGGKRKIKFHGKIVEAHFVNQSGVRAYLDDSGDPYRVEYESMTMERNS